MAKTRIVFRCAACGARFPRWMGQCTACGQWNSIEEAVESKSAESRSRPVLAGQVPVHKLGDIDVREHPRMRAGIDEWDRVLGGGIVPGSLILVGGDPGVGKSTLLLQVADALSKPSAVSPDARNGTSATGRHVWYVSGEESLPQVGLRARRLQLDPRGISLTSTTDISSIIATAEQTRPDLMVLDSIQSVYDVGLDSAPGNVTQLRECTLRISQYAKENHVAVVLIGHVTKEGVIAGPKTLEHMVDVVLYLEGERLQAYRLLRGVKNRFGATNEVGVFEMLDEGMAQVLNPSAAFLAGRVEEGSGSAIVVTLEGTRPMLVEVQALVTRSSLAIPRRVSNGIDFNRVILLSAVMSKRGNIPFNNYDIHVNVVGGIRVDETAADLGTSLAMISSYKDLPLDSEMVAIGEVGLAGELRTVSQMDVRLQEAAKLGFKRAIVPRLGHKSGAGADLSVMEAATLREAAARAGLG